MRRAVATYMGVSVPLVVIVSVLVHGLPWSHAAPAPEQLGVPDARLRSWLADTWAPRCNHLVFTAPDRRGGFLSVEVTCRRSPATTERVSINRVRLGDVAYQRDRLRRYGPVFVRLDHSLLVYAETRDGPRGERRLLDRFRRACRCGTVLPRNVAD